MRMVLKASFYLLASLFCFAGCSQTTASIQSPTQDAITQATAPEQVETDEERALREEAERRALAEKLARLETVENAAKAFRNALPADVETPKILLRTAELSVQTGDSSAADTLFSEAIQQHPTDTEWLQAYAKALILSEKFADTRKLARNAINKGADKNAMMDIFWNAYDNDPLYGANFVRTLPTEPESVIKALGGGSTVTFKHQVNEQNLAAIKPDQDLRQSMYRSEIAFFRICELLECSFDVPTNEALRISKSDFNQLYNRIDTPKQRGYKSKFEHLIWARENNSDYLYATYKEWVPDFLFFPIEIVSQWKPYLQINSPALPDMKTLISRIYSNSRPDHGRPISKVLDYLDGVSVETLMHQLSDMILLDFLTNNWDRFSGDENNYGANCHIHKGGLIAIDNGAAFPIWHTPRVEKRFAYIQRFSKKFVDNLREMDTDLVFTKLFPNPTKDETKSWKLFCERRQQALKRIDELIAKHGEKAVLF